MKAQTIHPSRIGHFGGRKSKLMNDMLNIVSPDIVFGDLVEIETVDEVVDFLKSEGFEHHFIYPRFYPSLALEILAKSMKSDGAPPLRDQMVGVNYVVHTPFPKAPNAVDVTSIMAFRNVADAVYVKMMLS